MSVSTFGTIRPADLNISDIDIFYNYSVNREAVPSEMFSINSTDVLSETQIPSASQVSGQENLLEGLFNLRLPSSIFSATGIYTLYIRPKSLQLKIQDCGVLSALPSVKGILVSVNDLPSNLQSNNALQGYKIEYINSDGTKLRNVVRYCITSNRAVPIVDSLGNTSQRSVKYNFDDSGSLIFLQISPNSASNVKPNVIPFIGTAGQFINISNTFFNPLCIEIEMVANTIDSIMNVIGGNQVKDVTNGILTIYDENNAIMKQFDLYDLKDSVGNVSLFNIKSVRSNIDNTQDFNNITSLG